MISCFFFFFSFWFKFSGGFVSVVVSESTTVGYLVALFALVELDLAKHPASVMLG